jgi:sugar phosphate isomerase/epimerase
VLKKSVVLTAFFPDSMEDDKSFWEALKAIKNYNLNFVEFYYKGNNEEKIKDYLEINDIKNIYLGAIALKQNNLNLSALNEEIREKSIREIKKCIDDAYFYNSQSTLINSGRSPKDEADNGVAYECLKKSMSALLDYIEKKSKNYQLKLTLEPGDTNIDSYSLIGHTDLAIKLIQELREKYDNVGLTMDTSHLIQLGEEPIDSIKETLPYCNHIHLANCIIGDKSHNLYGDKHPEFGIEGGEVSVEEALLTIEKIRKIYREDDLILGLEIIYHGNETKYKDELDHFNNMIKIMDWQN